MRDNNLEIVKDEKVCVLTDEYLTPEEYIKNLIEQLRKDIFPLFNTTGFAPFTILRNTFCFIDHVSALRYGIRDKNGEQTGRMKRVIDHFALSDNYINSKYKEYSDYLIQIFRHDLVHNVRPLPKKIKVIEKGRSDREEKISWFIVDSYIHDNAPCKFNALCDYFKKVRNRKGLNHLRYYRNEIWVNNWCLFFDFVNYLNIYKNDINRNQKLKKDFLKHYKLLVERNLHKIKDFVLDKNKNKEVKFHTN